MRKNKQLSNAEIASFCSQVAMLFQAGIPPVDSLLIMVSDATSESGKAILETILSVCKRGEPFHKALEATNVFPDYVIQMITLGEESGNLDECLFALGIYYDKEQRVADSIRSAVSYPFIMIVMMTVVIFVLISRVMPIFNQVFVELGSEMTGFAASLLTLGNNLNRYSVLLLILIAALVILYFLATKTRTGRRITTRFLHRFPLTKSFYESVACERFSSGLALCMKSGMDTYSSLDIVGQLVGSQSMINKINACKEQIRSGSNFAEALTATEIFNHLYSQMIAIGFKSGNIDVVLDKIAENYEKETDRKLQSIIAVLEPTLVIILSVIVGMILLSVILPLMGIMTSIG